jgi:hypothetical protein
MWGLESDALRGSLLSLPFAPLARAGVAPTRYKFTGLGGRMCTAEFNESLRGYYVFPKQIVEM